jgi:WD40 repeat protein
MRHFIFCLSCFSILLISFTSCQAQIVSPCRQQPAPKKQSPGIVGLSFSRDGKTMVSAGADGNVKVWNVATGHAERILSGHTNALYKAIFSPNEKLLASSGRDTTVRIWDVASGRELHKLTGHRCSIKTVAFSPDGKTLASVSNDAALKLWDVATGKELKSLVHAKTPDADVSVYSVVFSQDGKSVFAGNGDGTISEWHAASGKEARVWKAHSDGVFYLIFSSDYRFLVSNGYSDYSIKLWDAATRREIRTVADKMTEGLTEQIIAVAFTSNGKMIAASESAFDEKLKDYAYSRVSVWNTATGEKLLSLEASKFPMNAVTFTPDNRFVATGSNDGNIIFWDVKTGKQMRTITNTIINKAE